MAAPNLKSPTTITGKTATYSCTTGLSTALSNSAASGKALRINVIRASNVAVSGGITVDVSHYRGTTHTYLVKGATIGQSTSLVILQRDEYLYLEEGDSIYAKASANSSADLTITYEDWS